MRAHADVCGVGTSRAGTRGLGEKATENLLPVEIEVPTHIENNLGTAEQNPERPVVTYKPATELAVATWENSFTHDGSESPVRWWVTNDMDHFRVRIPRPDKKGEGTIKMTVETKNPTALSAYDDPENEVELMETPANSGFFEQTMMLVSDDVDDKRVTDATVPNGDGKDESLKDYTHKIAVGGEVIIRYEGNQIAKLKVPEKGRIRIRPIVLWYHGVFGGYPAVPTTEVEKDVRDIRERYTQAGIAVDWNGQDWGIDVAAVSGMSPEFQNPSQGSFTNDPAGATSDEVALMNYIKTTYPSLTDKDVIVIYTMSFNKPGPTGAYAANDKGAFTFIPSLATPSGISPYIMVAAGRNSHATAHETLHLLLNDIHKADWPLNAPEAGRNLMEFRYNRRLWSGGPNYGEITDRKRISNHEEPNVVRQLQDSSFIIPPP